MLSNLMQSQVNQHLLYVITQEGHIVMLDRRHNHRVVRKMPGSKGSIRDAILLQHDDIEFVITGGCDRYLRIFDVTKGTQKEC